MPEKTKAKSNGKKNSAKQSREEQQRHHRVLQQQWLEENALDAQDKQVKVTLTAEDAKRLLGWSEVDRDHHFVDCCGNKVVCHNNRNNRPYREADARKITQDILNRRYAFNGENIAIGMDGNVLQGQHRLIALVFAEQLRTGPQLAHWSLYWDGPVQIEAIVVYNVDESMHTTRTIDQTRTRTVADSLFVDPELSKYKSEQRRQIARLLEEAIKIVWKRTGYDDNLFHSKRTNAEMLSFRERHPRLLKAVKHIFDEDGPERRIGGPGRWVRPGVAAGLLYLMGCAASEGDDYRNPKRNKDGITERSEKGLDWSLWDRACEFWVMLAAGENRDEFIRNLRKCRRKVEDPEDKTSGFIFLEGSTQERAAALCKAWKVHLSGEKPTPGLFKLDYICKEGYPVPVLNEDPDVGGIDLGHNPYKPSLSIGGGQAEETDAATSSADEGDGRRSADPTPEEIESQAQAIREENATATGVAYSGNLD